MGSWIMWLLLVTVVTLAAGVALVLWWRRAICAARVRTEQDLLARRLLESREQERQRIAADLHDSLGQNLLVIRNRALMGLNSPQDPAAMAAQLTEISRVSVQTLEETRRIAHNLSTFYLDQLGLTEAIDAMVDHVEASTCMQFQRKLEPVDEVFSPEAATHVYRIIQESLNNIMKHAQATTGQVEVIRDLHHVRIAIRDDGRGFSRGPAAGELPRGGFGLADIQERVRVLKGSWELHNQPGHGTHLHITLPIPETAPAQPARG